ncbi:unnamed protein product [Symbiodinium necroappetens]|uniref:Uncharacterized protein n=1 Tax=Symbiodinium necroappetens TaxID=1628268 RepID=A0A812V9Z9_9DINO|nr:unnamed protein product [Symbiodinium necroappetens]
MAPKSGRKPTTISACLARAGFPQQLEAREAERTIAEVRRIARSCKAPVLSEEQLLSQLLRPVANLLLEFVPNFSSAAASSRLQFWRDAASVALGRTKAGAAYKQWLQTDAILIAAEHDLLTETLELPADRKRPLQGDAKGEPEPAAKRLCGSSGPSDRDPEALRRKQEMAKTVRSCQEDLEALRATQAKDLEIFLEKEERSMASRRARFHQTQADQVDQMQRQNMQIIADLRAQHLRELFSPCLWISSGEVQPWHGFYTLSTEDSTDTSPVYCKYNSSTPCLYAAKGEWCFSKNRANLVTKTGCGFVRSTSTAAAAPSVLLATGWRQLGEDRMWSSIDLRIEEVTNSTVEFVIVSLAGDEILRKSCVLSETVHYLRKQVQAARQSHDNIQLCLQNTRLRKSTPLGCLSLRPGETLQAVFGLRSCIACKTPITGPPSRCGSCARCHCAACARGLTRCRICGKRVCTACTASTAGWLFAGMCPRCARPWGF